MVWPSMSLLATARETPIVQSIPAVAVSLPLLLKPKEIQSASPNSRWVSLTDHGETTDLLRYQALETEPFCQLHYSNLEYHTRVSSKSMQ